MKGFLPLVGALGALILVFLVLIVGGTLLISNVPILSLLFQLYFIVLIYGFVRGMLGGGAVSLVVTALLAYIFVIRFWYFTAATWIVYLLISFGLTSIIFFGLQPMGGGTRAARKLFG